MPETQTAPRPVITIRASRGWSALRLHEVWQFRDLLFSLARRDLKLRYKQTALGVAWVVIQPLMSAAILAFVFGRVAGMTAPDGISYFLFAFAGFQGWNLFSGTLTKAGTSLVGNAHLITKVFFPRLVLPLSTVLSSLVDFACSAAVLAVLVAFNGIAPTWNLLLLPVWMAILLMLALGIGFITTSLAVFYRDVQFILPVFVQILFYASPVAYSVDLVPERFRVVYYLNPLSGVLDAFRWSVLGVGELRVGPVFYSGIVSAVLLLVGAFSFKRMERRFSDMI